MKFKVLIASGSRHTIPPVENSPGVPRIIYQLTEKDPSGFQFLVLSKYDKLIESHSFNRDKYIHPKPNFTLRLFEYILQLTPYNWRKKKYGFSQTDRIVYYNSLVKNAKQIKPDIVVTFMHFELFKILKKALPNSKHVFFFRSTDLKGRIGQQNIDFLIENSDGFLSNTKAPIIELTTHNTNLPFPVACIFNAVPEVLITKQEQYSIRTGFRVKFGLKESDFVLGYAGRFSEEKSLIEIFKVIKSLKDQGIIIHLIIAGDIKNEKTPNLHYYNELIAYKEDHLPLQIHLAGWITNSELYHFYCALDIGVLLSKYREGNSMFLIEAMSYGIPVIATAVGGNTEIITNNVSGFLIDFDKIESELKWLIVTLQRDQKKCKFIGENAREYVLENHTKEKMVDTFHNFIENLV
jgi:glycosyltransferase involved in cell wall biosynthesis